MSMSENSIDFGELEIRFSRPRTVCFVSGSMFFSCRTCLLSCMGFFIPSNSGTLSSVDHFGNCRFSSFCLTYGSRSEQSFSPLSSFLRAVCVERYISVGSRKMIRGLCRLAGRSPMPPSKTKKNSPHSFVKLHSCLAPSLRSASLPKVLPLLTAVASSKFPNGRERRPVASRGRRILPAGAEPRLKRIGQKSNSAKTASVTFSPASDDLRQGRSSDKRDAPNRASEHRSRWPTAPCEACMPATGGFA